MNDCADHVAITPETRIARLLETYPHLEELLIALAPAFARLRNPILRKTVAKITTLRQAALVGNIPLAELINKLRAAAGQSGDVPSIQESSATPDEPPAWFDPSRIVRRLDVRPMIERGEQPLGIVTAELKALADGEILELTAGFLPAPLIDLAAKQGFITWRRMVGQDAVLIFFCRAQGSR